MKLIQVSVIADDAVITLVRDRFVLGRSPSLIALNLSPSVACNQHYWNDV